MQPKRAVGGEEPVRPADVLNAFTRVQVAAEAFMHARDRADLGWVEESMTDIAVHAGLPEVRVVQFNRQQELPDCVASASIAVGGGGELVVPMPNRHAWPAYDPIHPWADRRQAYLRHLLHMRARPGRILTASRRTLERLASGWIDLLR